MTSVPNHFDPRFDSSKTRGKLAPSLFSEVSGEGVGWGHSIIEHTDIKRNILYQVPPTTDTWDGKRLSY